MHGLRVAPGVLERDFGLTVVERRNDFFVDVRFDVWFETRGDAREPRGVGRFVGILGGVSRPEFGGLVLRGSSVVGRRFAARSGRFARPLSLRGRRGRAVSKVPRLFIRQSLGMRIDAVHQFLKNLAH